MEKYEKWEKIIIENFWTPRFRNRKKAKSLVKQQNFSSDVTFICAAKTFKQLITRFGFKMGRKNPSVFSQWIVK